MNLRLLIWCFLSCLTFQTVVKSRSVYYGLDGRLKITRQGYQACGYKEELSAMNKKCCHGKDPKFYYNDISICCNGEVYDKFDKFNNSMSCCDDQVILDENFICCNNVKYRIPQGYSRDEIGCCGNVTLNKDEMCCRGNGKTTKQVLSEHISCCLEKPYDNRREWCQDEREVFHFNQRRCGAVVIDLRKNSCCQDTVNDWPEFKKNNIIEKDTSRACCGVQPYNNTNKRCCPNLTLIPKHPDYHCCGSGYFNATSELCCDSTIKPKIYGTDTMCCGTDVYNKRHQECCNGLKSRIYETSTSKCCWGDTSNVIPLNSTCCNGEELQEDSVCCDSVKRVKKSDVTHDSCCLSNIYQTAYSYNSENQICKNGELITKRSGNELCGQGKWYNPSEYICCNDNLTQRTRHTRLTCCGFFGAIDEKKQKCCNGYVLNFPAIEGICCPVEPNQGCHYNDTKCACTTLCNGKMYNPNIDICCGDKLYDGKKVKGCCGSLPLIEGQQTCCNGVRFNSTGECCGKRLLTSGETCCGDFAVQRLKKRSEKCCSRLLPFDSRYSHCNELSGKVFSLHQTRRISKECQLSQVHKHRKADKYGWIPAACNSKYGFKGTITEIKTKQNKELGMRFQEITLTRVRSVKRQKYKRVPKSLTIRMASVNCLSRMKRLNNTKVAIFTSAILKSGIFDFIDYEINRNSISYASTEFYSVKYSRHLRQTLKALLRSHFCDQQYQYFYVNRIR